MIQAVQIITQSELEEPSDTLTDQIGFQVDLVSTDHTGSIGSILRRGILSWSSLILVAKRKQIQLRVVSLGLQ